MYRKHVLMLLAVSVVFALGCSKRVMVEVPPRVDLQSYDVIGIVEFTSDAEGTLPSFATQRFIEELQRSQPGVRVLELGSDEKLKETTGQDRLDFEAMKIIKEQYGVGAVIVGNLEVSDVRPTFNVQDMISSMSVSAEVDASLTTRIYETALGATIWTRSTKRTNKVAQAGVGGNGSVVFDAQDPDRAYGALVDGLVHDVTRDFRVSYVRE